MYKGYLQYLDANKDGTPYATHEEFTIDRENTKVVNDCLVIAYYSTNDATTTNDILMVPVSRVITFRIERD